MGDGNPHKLAAAHREGPSRSSTITAAVGGIQTLARAVNTKSNAQSDAYNQYSVEPSIKSFIAAELCRIAPDQASRLLRRMVRDGTLRMAGSRRTARYFKR